MGELFRFEDGVCGYAHRPILRDVGFHVQAGQVFCILGPNGVGKSTLFKSMLGLIPLLGGAVRVEGEDIASWSRAKIAQAIGYIPQTSNPPFSYTVMDVVLMGRTAYLGAFSPPKEEDEDIAVQAIERLGLQTIINRPFLELSGGQRQLVLIARALAQQPKVLVMDEPTASLDFGNQQLVLNQIRQLSEQGLAVVMASHAPDHAFLYADKVLMLKDGGMYAEGEPREVITERSLFELYGVHTKIVDTGLMSSFGDSAILTCVPLG